MKSKALNGLAYGEADSGLFEKEDGGYVGIERSGRLPNPLEEWDTAATYLTWERGRTSPQRNEYRSPEELFEELAGEDGEGLDFEEMAARLTELGHLCEPIYRGAEGIGLSGMPYATSVPWPVGLAFVEAEAVGRENVPVESLRILMESEMEAYAAWAAGDVWEAREYDGPGAPRDPVAFYGLADLAEAYPSLEPAAPDAAARIEGRPYVDPRGAVVLGTFERGRGEKPNAALFVAGSERPFVAAAAYDAATGVHERLGSYADPMRAWAQADPRLDEASLSVRPRDAAPQPGLPARDPAEAWRAACEAFKADPRSLEDWRRDVRDALAAAAGDPPCWGRARAVEGIPGYVPEDAFARVLPLEEQLDLFRALEGAKRREGLPGPSLDDVAAACERVSDASWFHDAVPPDDCAPSVELTPEDYGPEDILRFAEDRPDLFDEASCAEWPELAEAKGCVERTAEWRAKCDGFASDPESLKDWYREKSGEVLAAASPLPCWGGAVCVNEDGACVSAADFEDVLPTPAEQDLYLALSVADGAGGGGRLSLGDIARSLSWQKSAYDLDLGSDFADLADELGVGFVEVEPCDFGPEELARLAKERPGLFDEESCAKWPELARAKEAAAFDARLDGAARSSAALDEEKRAPGRGRDDRPDARGGA